MDISKVCSNISQKLSETYGIRKPGKIENTLNYPKPFYSVILELAREAKLLTDPQLLFSSL